MASCSLSEMICMVRGAQRRHQSWKWRLASNSRPFSTHEVFNQSEPFLNIDVFNSDPALKDGLMSFNGGNYGPLENFGQLTGSSHMMRHAELAEKNRPVLRQFDNNGRRIDVAEYHDSYHSLMEHGLCNGVAAYGFRNSDPGSQVIRGSLIYMENQLDAGHCCPIVMTAAAIPVFKRHAAGAAEVGRNGFDLNEWLRKLLSQQYDPRDLPIQDKEGVTVGMSMTEKQGGSDVRANTTFAKPWSDDPADAGLYALTGHKWFTSAPMCDGFLTLAYLPSSSGSSSGSSGSGGTKNSAPSCFLVPRWLPDGRRNSGFRVMRLKNKLGDGSNASSEVEYDGAWAQLMGEPGRGVRTIIEMVQSTRLDCALGSAGGARRALQLALHHANGRQAFGRRLIEQPLMRNVLTDLCVEAEAHTLTALYMAHAFGRYYQHEQSQAPVGAHAAGAVVSSGSHSTSRAGQAGRQFSAEQERDLFRLGVSVSKYFITKRLPGFTYECMEAMGGNGYVEDFPLARLFRQSPLNSIWEGSGNVMALDILRARAALPTLFADIQHYRGLDVHLDAFVLTLEDDVERLLVSAQDPRSADTQRAARNVADRLATALCCSVLLRFGDPQVAKAFVDSRVRGRFEASEAAGVNYGGAHVFSEEECSYVLDRNMPIFY